MRLGFVYAFDTVLKNKSEPKYGLCICEQKNYCIWINSNPSFHGIGQIPLREGDHDYIVKDCFFDFSGVKIQSDDEIIINFKPHPRRISATLARSLQVSLAANPPSRLPQEHYNLILDSLNRLASGDCS